MICLRQTKCMQPTSPPRRWCRSLRLPRKSLFDSLWQPTQQTQEHVWWSWVILHHTHLSSPDTTINQCILRSESVKEIAFISSVLKTLRIIIRELPPDIRELLRDVNGSRMRVRVKVRERVSGFRKISCLTALRKHVSQGADTWVRKLSGFFDESGFHASIRVWASILSHDQGLSSFLSLSFAELRRQLFGFRRVSFSFIPKLVIPIKMSLNREIKSCQFAFQR